MNRAPPQLSRLAIFTAALFAAELLPSELSAQSVIHGVVTEDVNGRPVNIAVLRLLRPDGSEVVQATSESDGSFRMEVADTGLFTLAVSRVGFQPISADSIEVYENDDIELEVRLDPVAVVLQAVTVVAQRQAIPPRILQFRERAALNQRAGIGRIWTREDLASLRPHSAQDVLDRVLWANRCRPLVMLDGLPFEGPMTMLGPDEIEGIEVYRGVTQIPPQYYRYGMCGLAMVWSRHDPPGMRPLTWRRAVAAGTIVLLLGLMMR
ncbi:MAG: carboxypeptidase-like regulatory domain-containing protein [Gemmatimonadota bacterium]|jgi:hypothetical protein|nr:carboxypeptidase-like regulatory domain-containing protein [Gemmatimonadota bacterium]